MGRIAGTTSLTCLLGAAARGLPALLVAPLAGPVALAQRTGPAVRYEVAFPNRAHHEAEISATFPGLPPGVLEVRMSRSSPGRYAVHEFAKNVYRLRAEDSRGRALPVTRPNPHQWNVSGHDGTVRLHYTLFGDRADGTYSGIDRTHAHLNIPATFAWARGLDDRPIAVTFSALPPDWGIATQLAPAADPATFTAPNLQLFMDSPIELSDFDLRTWTVSSGGRDQTLRLAIHHAGPRALVDTFVSQIQRVVAEHEAVFGELPAFDGGVYTFLADYLPTVSGDGMEHRNSTVLTSTRDLATGLAGNLGTVAHEFFHAWNVERIRPAGLEPFDFEEANLTGELWLAEGFTSYYGPLAIQRAGLSDLDQFARGLGGTVNAIVNAPGRGYHSPREMSMLAPFVDAATSIDPTNFSNTFVSYYTWGAGVALALDLTLRDRFSGLSADDFMRAMWVAHGVTERPYGPADIRAVLGRVTGDTAFAGDFWRRYLEGREAPDYAALLARAGLLLRPANPDRAWLGDQGLRLDGASVIVAGPARVGSPLYRAGLDRGDRIVELGGRAVAALEDVEAVLATHRPGDTVAVRFESRGVVVEGTLGLSADPRVEVVTYEAAGLAIPEPIRAFREAWLRSRVAR